MGSYSFELASLFQELQRKSDGTSVSRHHKVTLKEVERGELTLELALFAPISENIHVGPSTERPMPVKQKYVIGDIIGTGGWAGWVWVWGLSGLGSSGLVGLRFF